MLIEVTQDDIERGVVADCFRCPIANAVRDVLGPDAVVRVECDFMDIGAKTVKLPIEAMKFIEAFDAEESVEPFSFEVEYEPELASV